MKVVNPGKEQKEEDIISQVHTSLVKAPFGYTVTTPGAEVMWFLAVNKHISLDFLPSLSGGHQ